MQRLVIVLMLLFVSFFYGQDENASVIINESKITSLIYTVDSIQELKSVNWDDVIEIFKTNKKKDSIVFGFRVKNLNKEKIKFKHSLTIKAEAENIDETIKIARNIITAIEKF